MDTFSTHGGTQTVVLALLFSLAILIIGTSLGVALARRYFKRAFHASREALVPLKLESRVVELEATVTALSSSFEKVTREFARFNSRVGMRDLRERQSPDSRAPPPPGASKVELRRYYGFGQDGPEFARRQLQLVPPPRNEE